MSRTRFAPARSSPIDARVMHIEDSLTRLSRQLADIINERVQTGSGYAVNYAGGGGQIGEAEIAWDVSDGHNHDGSESRAVDILGDVTGDNTASVVAQIQGIPVVAPVAGDDLQFARYNNGTPNITWEPIPAQRWTTVTKTGNYTLTDLDYIVLVDATTGAVTITTHAAATAHQHPYVVIKIDASANTVTLDGNAAETISGAATQVIAAQWGSLTIVTNNTAWFMI